MPDTEVTGLGAPMPTAIDRDELQRLLREEQTQLVEVLPRDEYEDEHLPGAINIPLKTLDAETTGRVGRKALAMEEDVAVEAVMTAGPSTVRPSITLAAIVERMHGQKLTSALVTRSDGTLVGLLRRTDAEASLNAATSEPSVSSKGREGP